MREAKGQDAFHQPYLLHDLVEKVTSQIGVERDQLPDLIWGDITRSGLPVYPRVTAQELYLTYQALMDAPFALVENWRQALHKSDLETPHPED